MTQILANQPAQHTFAGLRFNGTQENPYGDDFFLFTDTAYHSPAYGATFAVPVTATTADVLAKLASTREAFAGTGTRQSYEALNQEGARA